ncbi:2-hydroxychromene-2-carboxylate isomerase [Roseospira goensis]|uniref:2-hydroxychromene-2-carboxylate isomerase n=1 Tax=Roseospira goensis TaxID=391922 RepID=A0A7W6WKY6_9PROT|nr:2-hydroxychromene-2-carboxylate isomerase [Roseospira goensis]MBB4286560.1 2-hydroxychromene-2-carboxylate isomerase [Roseospira goensis]
MTAPGPALTAFYELASTYSYLAVMRLQDAAARAGVTIAWRPFLLGPIFKAQGWDTSPFNLYPAKGRYMWRDMARRCAAAGLPLVPPSPFPANGLLAARAITALADDGDRPRATRALFRTAFGTGRDIADPAVVRDALDGAGLEGAALVARAADPAVKAALRAATDAAVDAGVFGAPSFVTADGELFWGDDRLEDALAWATEGALPAR